MPLSFISVVLIDSGVIERVHAQIESFDSFLPSHSSVQESPKKEQCTNMNSKS